jgi:hypothetical protein
MKVFVFGSKTVRPGTRAVEKILNPLFVAPNVAYPILPSSSLELIDPQTWATIDG